MPEKTKRQRNKLLPVRENVAECISGIFQDAFLRSVIDVNKPESFRVALRPLEVIHEVPTGISDDGRALFRAALRFAVRILFLVAFILLFPLWRGLERGGFAAARVYSSTRHSANFIFYRFISIISVPQIVKYHKSALPIVSLFSTK